MAWGYSERDDGTGSLSPLGPELGGAPFDERYMRQGEGNYSGNPSQRAANFSTDYAQFLGNKLGWNEEQARILGQSNYADKEYRAALENSVAARNAYQQTAADLMLRRALGLEPSISDLQMRLGQQQATQNAMAMAASSRTNPAAAQRAAIMAGSEQQASLAAQGAIARAAEQQAAEQALMGAGETMRGQDLAQSNIASQRGVAYSGQSLSGQQNLQATASDAMQRSLDRYAGVKTQKEAQDAAMKQALIGGISSGIGAIIGAA